MKCLILPQTQANSKEHESKWIYCEDGHHLPPQRIAVPVVLRGTRGKLIYERAAFWLSLRFSESEIFLGIDEAELQKFYDSVSWYTATGIQLRGMVTAWYWVPHPTPEQTVQWLYGQQLQW